MIGCFSFISYKRTFTHRRCICTFKESCPLIYLIKHCQIKALCSCIYSTFHLLPEETSPQSRNHVLWSILFHVMPTKARKQHRHIIFTIRFTPLYIFLYRLTIWLIRIIIKTSHQPWMDNIRLFYQFEQSRIRDSIYR